MELEHVWEEEIIRTCHTQAMQTNSIESCHLKKKNKKEQRKSFTCWHRRRRCSVAKP